MLQGKVLVAQGGGPTAVINQSLAGAVLESRKFRNVSLVYGALHGVRGIVDENFVDLTQETTHNLEAIADTPSSALGSTRDKPDLKYCQEIFKVLQAHEIRYFFYIGGNDSSDTVRIVAEEAHKAKHPIRCIHIPKTIDNDLVLNDHTPAAPTSAPSTPSPRPDDHAPEKPTELYQAATPAEYDRAITDARKMAHKVESDFNVHFATIETPHFLIFTDWDPQEYQFLKTNFEDAYKAVTEQFNIPYSDNVFIGKLPVLMFARFADYAHFTDSIGFYGKKVDRSLRGYYEGSSDGSGRMVMYKPAGEDIQQAELQWAHAVVHEFTHAFVARYHSNARVPRWLNEGVAEVIAAQHFPFEGTYPFAKRMAAEHRSAGTLFDDKVNAHRRLVSGHADDGPVSDRTEQRRFLKNVRRDQIGHGRRSSVAEILRSRLSIADEHLAESHVKKPIMSQVPLVNDPFAALGLPRQFDVDATALATARDQTGNIDAFNVLSDPRQRAEALMTFISGPTAAKYVGTPLGFSDEIAQAQGDPGRLAAIKAERWNNVAHLFPQLLGFDKAPTQTGRARMMRAELNAIDSMK